MRTISDTALTELSKQFAVEPVIIIGVAWNRGEESLYSTKPYQGIEPRIISFNGPTQTTSMSGSEHTEEASVVLSDYDGELARIFNTLDIHKCPVTIYQYFEGLALTEKFPILSGGQINTPITWNESARTLSFSIVSMIESQEAGFNTASGRVVKKGKVETQNWPLAFGDVFYVPATKVNDATSGKVLTPFGKVDILLERKRDILVNRGVLLSTQLAYLTAYDASILGSSPNSARVLQRYLDLIGEQDQADRQIRVNLDRLEKLEDLIKKAVNKVVIFGLELAKKAIEVVIKRITDDLANIVVEKEKIGLYIEEIRNVLQMHKEIISKMQTVITEILKNNEQLDKINDTLAKQYANVKTSITVQDGEYFPQGSQLEVIINNLRFVGSFTGNTFNFATEGLAKYKNVSFRNGHKDTFYLNNDSIVLEGMTCLVETLTGYHIIKISSQVGTTCTFDLQEIQQADPSNQGDYSGENGAKRFVISESSKEYLVRISAQALDDDEVQNIIQMEDLIEEQNANEVPDFNTQSQAPKYVVTSEEIVNILEVSPIILPSWLQVLPNNEVANLDSANYFIPSGSDVTLAEAEEVIYVANMLPSSVYGVYAYKSVGDSGQVLYQVPPQYYTVSTRPSGDLTLTIITFHQSLTAHKDQGWQDQIYVTLRSPVGPNPVVIMKWLIDTFTGYSYDATSFGEAEAALQKYPANFAIFDSRGVHSFLQDIAQQSRCTIYLKGYTYYIYYESAARASVGVFTEDDILVESLEVSTTETEDISTKVVASWQQNYLPDSQQTVELQYNVNKYGLSTRGVNYYIYTDRDLVEKSATFLMIRTSNLWKYLTFQTPITKLPFEAHDTITLNFSTLPLAAFNGDCVIESTSYDPQNKTITFTVWTPFRLGDYAAYPFAFPSDVTSNFPNDVDKTNAGSPLTINLDFNRLSGIDPNAEIRPDSWGRQINADSADSVPTPPLNDWAVAPEVVPNYEVGTFHIPPFNDQLRNLKVTKPRGRDPLPRPVYVGAVIEADDNNNEYTVALQNGRKVIAGLYGKQEFDVIRTGRPCVVVKGETPDSWWLLAELFDPEIRNLIILKIDDNTYECEQEDGTKITVARPFSHCRINYDGKIDAKGYLQTFVSTDRRNLERAIDGTILVQYLNNAPAVGDNIMAVKAPHGFGGTTIWIDTNNNGSEWITVPTFYGTVAESQRQVGSTATIKVYIEGVPHTTNMDCNLFADKYYFQVGDKVVAEYNKHLDVYRIINYYGVARHIVLKVRDDEILYRTDVIYKGDLVSWWDGVQPNNELTVKNDIGAAAIGGDYLICERVEEGYYTITDVRHKMPVSIRFKLTKSLVRGGSTSASIMEYTKASPFTLVQTDTVTVKDSHARFNGDVGYTGLGTLIPDIGYYEIIYLGRNVEIIRFKLTGTLTNGGSASAVERLYTTSSSLTDGNTITVYDTQGIFSGSSGATGYATRISDDPSSRYEIIQLHC